MSKPAENVNTGNDEYFMNLERAIETALNNAKLFEVQTSYNFGLYFKMICCEYLHCDLADLFETVESIDSPRSIVYGANIIQFAHTHYHDMYPEIAEIENRLVIKNVSENILNNIVIHTSPFEKRCDLKYYPLYNKKEGLYLPKAGVAAIEDEDGFRMIVYFETYGVNDKDINIKIVANIKSCDYRIKIGKFRENLDAFCKAHPVFHRGIYKPNGDAVDFIEAGWNDLKIPASTRKEIDFHIINFIKKIDSVRMAGLKTNRGIILYGKPGNGKTLLGRILASTMDVPVIQITPKDVIQNYSGPNIKDIYDFADMIAPCIVFIEDGDIYLNDRTMNHKNSELLSEFLNCMDGLRQNNGVLTILTANNPELLDEALKNRPKRFDVMIEMADPGMEERAGIIGDIIKPYLCEDDEYIITETASLLEGFSGAHVHEFSERIVLDCIYRSQEYISMETVNRELEKFGFKPIRSSEQNVGFAISN